MSHASPHEMLIRMANHIGEFFSSMPDAEEARRELAAHIRRYWEPRMRRGIFEHIDRTQGHGLRELVLTALTQHRAELMPAN
jgi:formate dehydrogenase subunit delta